MTNINNSPQKPCFEASGFKYQRGKIEGLFEEVHAFENTPSVDTSYSQWI